MGYSELAVEKMNNAATKLCGYSDWRLPTFNELSSLMNFKYQDTYGNGIALGSPSKWLELMGFKNFSAGAYTSSNFRLSSSIEGAREYMRVFFLTINSSDFYAGHMSWDKRLYVLPVRNKIASAQDKVLVKIASPYKNMKDESYPPQPGQQWPNKRFIKNGDCMIDTLTGLMWPKNGNIRYTKEIIFPHVEILSQPDYNFNPPQVTGVGNSNYVTYESTVFGVLDNLNNKAPIKLCGYSDWRLPTINELMSLFNNYPFKKLEEPPLEPAWRYPEDYLYPYLISNGFRNITMNYQTSTKPYFNISSSSEYSCIKGVRLSSINRAGFGGDWRGYKGEDCKKTRDMRLMFVRGGK